MTSIPSCLTKSRFRNINSPAWPLFFAAAAVRLAVAAVYVHVGSWELLPLREPYREFAGTDGHVQIARTLWETGEYAYRPSGPPVHNRPPLPPLLMAVVCAWSVERWYVYWFVAAAFLGAGTVYFSVRAMETCGAPRRQISVWGTALVLHPFLLSATRTSSFLPTGLFVFSLATYAFCRWAVRGYVFGDGIRTGAALGGAALTHGALILLAPVALAAAALDGRATARRRIRAAALVALVSLGCVVPWTWRNYVVFDKFIPVATGAGIQYWLKKAALTQEENLELRVFFQETGREPVIDHYGARHVADEDVFLRLALRDWREGAANFFRGLLYFFAPPENGRFRMILAGTLNVFMLLFAFHGLKTKIPPVRMWVFGATAALTATFSLLAGHAAYFTLLVPLWAVAAAVGFFRRFAV